MTRTTITGSAVGSVVLGLFLLRAAAPTSSGPTSATVQDNARTKIQASAAAPYPGQSAEGPWRASQNHFAGINKNPCLPTSSNPIHKDVSTLGDVTLSLRRGPTPAIDTGSQRWCIPPGEKVRAMIAIVPDPIQSPMPLQFDRSVEAIQLAAESLDYVMDRYWLPWISVPRVGGSDSREAATEEDAAKRNQPGLLMFRWDGPANDRQPTTLYIFLVGDVPTAGINGAQFDNAVNYVVDICRSNGESKCGPPTVIMGPTFSGSLSSLRRLARAHENSKFIAYSGTVSSICAVAKQGLIRQQEYEQKEYEAIQKLCLSSEAPESTSNVEFHSLMYSTESAVQSLVSYLKNRDEINCGARPDIALFSEASTTYGHIQRDLQRRMIKDPCYVTFSYPREISSLRNAYTGNEPLGVPASAENTSVPSYLPFNLADRQINTSDEPPDFAQQGPLSKEAVLLSFAAELRRNHFKYIGIEGSNVLDVLFLASFLRKACPDVRLFAVNSDLLFERDPDNGAYIGTLTLTTYPLIPTNLEWTNAQIQLADANQGAIQLSPRLPFADQYEEGQYNAGLLAIKKLIYEVPNAELYEFRKPFQSSPKDFDQQCLPLWLTAVGNGGYWPIEIMAPGPTDCNSDSGQPLASTVELKDGDFSPAWKAAVTMLCAVALFHIALLVTASPLRSRFRDFDLVRAAPGARFFFINVGTASLAAALIMLIAPVWCFGRPAGFLTCLKFMAPAFALALFLTCLGLYPRFWWVVHRQRAFNEIISSAKILGYTLACVGIVWAPAIIGVCFWWRLLRDDFTHYGFFFGYRSVHLATGISPFTPMLLLLAALYCWAMLEIWRLRFNNQLRPRLETTGSFPGASREESLAKSINLTFLRGNYLVSVLLVFTVWLFFLQPTHPFEIFEHRSFGIIYEVLFCLMVLLMLTAGFRLAHIWSELKGLLAELDQSRVRLAFGHLKEYSWSPIWQAGVQEIEWTSITRSLEVLRQIKSCDPKPDPHLLSQIANFEDQIEEFRDARMQLKKDGRWHRIHGLNIAYFRIQRQLAALLNTILAMLEIHWNTECPPQEEETDTESEKQPVIVHCKTGTPPDPYAQQIHRMQQFVAQRYVAFIRGILAQIRRLIILVTILFSLILVSLNIYSFEPHQSLIWSFTALFAIIGFTVIVVLMQVNRDHILSRVTGNKPNKLDLDFYVRVATFGAAPLLTVLATHFPSIGRFLLSLFQPGLEALK